MGCRLAYADFKAGGLSSKILILNKFKIMPLFLTNVLCRKEQSVFTDL